MTTNTLSTEQASTIAAEVLHRLETAWNAGDGDAYGAVYTPDASFVTIRGEQPNGRTAIAAGHAGIFATIYAGSTNQIQLLQAQPLSDDTVIAISRATMTAPHGPLQGTNDAISTAVLVRSDDTWLIRASQNTLVVSGTH